MKKKYLPRFVLNIVAASMLGIFTFVGLILTIADPDPISFFLVGLFGIPVYMMIMNCVELSHLSKTDTSEEDTYDSARHLDNRIDKAMQKEIHNNEDLSDLLTRKENNEWNRRMQK